MPKRAAQSDEKCRTPKVVRNKDDSSRRKISSSKLLRTDKQTDGKHPPVFCRLAHLPVARSNLTLGLSPMICAAAFTQGHRLAGGSRPQRVLTFSVPRSLWGADCLLKIFAASLSGNRAACRAEQIHSIAVAAYDSGCDCERGGDKAAYEIVRFEEGQARHREQQQRACGEAV